LFFVENNRLETNCCD